MAEGRILPITSAEISLVPLRPNTPRKSSPVSMDSSSSSQHTRDGNSYRTHSRTSVDNVDAERINENRATSPTVGSADKFQECSSISYLSRVRENNDIIITSIPTTHSSSPSSSMSSSKEDFERQRPNRESSFVQSSHKSSNDKRIPHTSTSVSANFLTSSTSITRIPSSSTSSSSCLLRDSSQLHTQGELLISPATDSEFDEMTSDHSQKYLLHPNTTRPSDSYHKQTSSGGTIQYQKGLPPSIPSYLLNSHHNHEPRLSEENITSTLGDHLDADCSRLLQAKRDLIVERVVQQPQHKDTSAFSSSPSELFVGCNDCFAGNNDSSRHTG